MDMYGYGSEYGKDESALAKLKKKGVGIKDATMGKAGQMKAKVGSLPGRQMLGNTLTGAKSNINSLAKSKVAKAGVPLAVLGSFSDSANEDSTARYAQRFGVSEPTGDGSFGDIAKFTALRAGGFASDLGNNLLLGLPQKYLYRDGKNQSVSSNALAPIAQKNDIAPQENEDVTVISGGEISQQTPLMKQKPEVDPFSSVDVARQQLAETMLATNNNQSSFKPKEGYNPLNVNANAQDLVNQALESIKSIQNPAQAETLGDAFSQKLQNKVTTDKALTMAKSADQLNKLANDSLGMRQGEQGLVKGDVGIDQARQQFIAGDVGLQMGKQKLIAGKNELDQKDMLKKTLDEYANPKTTQKRRQELADLALTLQGKEPANRFDVRANADGSSYVIDKQTGAVNPVGGAMGATATGIKPEPPTKGAKQQGPDGIFYEFDGNQWNPIK